jgi:hypothetical protein
VPIITSAPFGADAASKQLVMFRRSGLFRKDSSRNCNLIAVLKMWQFTIGNASYPCMKSDSEGTAIFQPLAPADIPPKFKS